MATILYAFSNEIILVCFQIPISFVLLSFIFPEERNDLLVYPNLPKLVWERPGC